MDEEILLLLFGICGLGVFFLPLILVLVLWTKVGRLRADVESLRLRLRQPPTAVRRPDPMAESPTVAPDEIEIVDAPAPSHSSIPRAVTPSRRAPTPTESLVPDADPPTPAKAPISLEEILAGKWLTWVAAIALIIGAGLFFKHSIENEWIGERGRVAIGLIIGAGTFAGAAFAMRRNYRWFGQALAGAASGILYFALYAAFGFYYLIPLEAAFAGMAVVTAASLAFSTIFNAQSTAIIGLIGGFLTPLMLSQGVDRQWDLFSYIFLLDLGVLGIASFRRWQPLQITAFCFTLLMWTGWFARFYEPAKLTSTLVLMTAYFVLFALLGVWHNALRRLPARPGDLFLMLATPIVYFIALYAVTKDQYEAWHGLMAVGLAAVYVGLGSLQLARNPAGKLTVLALGGIAASFVTVAVPLQLTGHWIAIAWAAESLLLVELGLRFEQPKLRWAGFGLLLVVQLILFSYAGETIDNPRRFSTRFVAFDPGTELMPIDMDGVAAASQGPAEPSWTDVFNGRSFSFLASAAVLAVLAWEYRRRSRTSDLSVPRPTTGWLLAAVPLTILGMFALETFSLGFNLRWSEFTVLGLVTAWTAGAALVVLLIALFRGPRWVERVAAGLYAVVGLLLVGGMFATLVGWRSEWSQLQAQGPPGAYWSWAIANPRGLGFAAAIASAVAACVAYARLAQSAYVNEGDSTASWPQLPSLLGVFAHLWGLALVTTEVYAQGVIRNWQTWTALSVTLVWLVYALATLIAGIYYRSATVRVLALLLFTVTAGKVFLYDVWHVSAAWKTVAFIALGVALMLVSYFYRRHRDRIRAWVQAASLAVAALLITDATPAVAQELTPAPLQTLEYRWPLTAGQPTAEGTLAGVALPPDLYEVARHDLADIRLLAVHEGTESAEEIPYVLHRPTDQVDVRDRPVELLNLSQTTAGTEFLLDLGEDPQPIREITVDVDDGVHNYQRDVRVYGGDARTDVAALLTDDGLLFDAKRGAEHARLNRVSFPRSQFRFYRVLIENGPDAPLSIVGARVADRKEIRAPRREYPAEIIGIHEDSERRATVVVVDLQYQNLPTTGLRLEIASSGDFYRRANIEVTESLDDERSWGHVASFDVFHVQRPGRDARRSTSVEFPDVRGRYLRIMIENGDDRPLSIQRATAVSIDRWLVFEWHRIADAKQPVSVFAADQNRLAPQYDLARTIGDVRVAELIGTARIGPRESNSFYIGPTTPKRPWSEEHAALVWGLTIGGVVIFGALTALMLWKAAGTRPEVE